MASFSLMLFITTLLLPSLLAEERDLLEDINFEKVAAELNNNIKKAFSQIPKEPGISLADKTEIRAHLKRIHCDDEEKTMEALKLISPEEVASPRGLENDQSKAVQFVSQIVAAMRKPCYYKLKDIR